ncbi:MAG: hypothetical protein IT425_06825 [Pirellulales bacterium]|nr:hypothetical protein [Pirellulales bacterium]
MPRKHRTGDAALTPMKPRTSGGRLAVGLSTILVFGIVGSGTWLRHVKADL